MKSRLLTVEEVSSYLHIHPQTVYYMARKGELPVVRIRSAVRFDKLAIDKWIQRQVDANEEKLLQLPDDRC